MQDSKLMEMVRGLSKNEFKRFGVFIRSPFFNQSEKIVLLYNYFKKYSGDFQTDTITREKISKYVYKGEEYNDQKTRSIISDFTKLLEKFLIYIQDEKNLPRQRNVLLRAMRERNITKSFESTLKEQIEYYKNEFNRDDEYYLSQIYIERELREFTQDKLIFNRHKEFNLVTNLKNIIDNTDFHFILRKLDETNYLINHRKTINKDIDINFWLVEAITDYVTRNIEEIMLNHPLVYTYYLVLMMQLNPDEEKFFYDLKDFVFLNQKRYIYKNLKQTCINLRNWCNIKYQKQCDPKYLQLTFEIYKNLDEAYVFRKENFLFHIEFLNVVFVGLELGEYEWVKNFIEVYSEKLVPRVKDDTMNLALAQYLYYTGDKRKALEPLSIVGGENFYFYLKTKQILMFIYYDLNEFEALTYVTDAVKHYLRRNRAATGNFYDYYMKFTNFLGKLVNIKITHKDDIHLIKKQLQDESDVAGAYWLYKKLDELENSLKVKRK